MTDATSIASLIERFVLLHHDLVLAKLDSWTIARGYVLTPDAREDLESQAGELTRAELAARVEELQERLNKLREEAETNRDVAE